MSESLLTVAKWAAVAGALLAGIVLSHGIYLSYKFSNAEGYFWLAARKIKNFLLVVLLAELLIGFFVYLSVFYWLPFPYPVKLLSAVVFGMVIPVFPHFLEAKNTLPTKNPFERLRRPLTKILLKYNLAIRYRFATAVSSLRERDVYDCQDKSGWGLGLSRQVIGRRIRIIYELKKIAIATERRDANFLRYDNNRNPWEKFYILVRHMGRRELRRCIREPPLPPRLGWEGNENRREDGTKADRKQPDSNPDKSRCYDYHELVKRVEKGENLISELN